MTTTTATITTTLGQMLPGDVQLDTFGRAVRRIDRIEPAVARGYVVVFGTPLVRDVERRGGGLASVSVTVRRETRCPYGCEQFADADSRCPHCNAAVLADRSDVPCEGCPGGCLQCRELDLRDLRSDDDDTPRPVMSHPYCARCRSASPSTRRPGPDETCRTCGETGR